VLIVLVPACPVGNAVENARHIVQDAAKQVAVHLDAKIAVGDQIVRQPALDKGKVQLLLQPFQAEWSLEFPYAQFYLRKEAGVHIGILEDEPASREIRHESEIEIPRQRAFEEKPRDANGERARRSVGCIAGKESAVGLEMGTHFQIEVTVWGSKRKTIRARAGYRAVFLLCLSVFLF